jgi:predicted DNA-binding protein
MNTAAIYVRVPSELKDKIKSFAKSSGKQQTEVVTELVNQGFLYPDTKKELANVLDRLSKEQEESRKLRTELQSIKAELKIAQQKLDNAERAKEHLERILNTNVGRCTECRAPINLYNFAFQQCPNGHSRRIELHDDYRNRPGVGDAVVAGLAIFGGIALAAELLGGNRSGGTS